MRKIEVCCATLGEIRESIEGGAIRVELCGAISSGGITPSHGLLRKVAEANFPIEINVLIRAREGSFLYTDEEVETMCEDIRFCRELGFNGVVIGALTAQGDIDIAACRKMKQAAGELSVTFHRAFDVCRNPREALEQIIDLGCNRLLTSGQEPTAELGAELIAELVEQAAQRIIIMAGAGVRAENIAYIEKKTRAAEFHSTARIKYSDGMLYRNPRVSFAPNPADEGFEARSSSTIVSQLVNNTL